MSSKLSPDAKRLRTIIISLPVLIATSAILYRRTYLGEEQRRIPVDPVSQVSERVAGGIGGAPWEVHGSKDQEALRSPNVGVKRNL